MTRVLRAAAAIWVASTLAACASERASDADAALVVCTELRAFDDELVDIVNESVAGIASMPADERADAIAGGVEDARAAIGRWSTRIDQIDLPGIDEAGQIRAQLHAGVDRAVAEIGRQHAELRAGPIADRDVQGVVGDWFNSIEKVMSVTEPEIFRFERQDFKQAFLDEPACRNVIQQFVND